MKIKILPLLFLAGCVPLCAFAPHPTVLTVKFKEQMLPVAKVIGTDPVVMVDGKEKRIRTEPLYLPQRAEAFGDSFVHFVSVSLGGMELKTVVEDDTNRTPSTGPRFGTSYFKATVKSKRPLVGGFAVVVVYSPTKVLLSSGSQNNVEVMVHALPELPAGEETAVSFSSAIPDGARDQTYFVQVFDGNGREAATNVMGRAWLYYGLRERQKLVETLAVYRQKFVGASRPAAPIMMARPYIPEDLSTPAEPGTATLIVSPEGTVAEVTVEGIEDQRVKKCVTDALGGWLFLPKLKDGNPVPSRVKIPIQF